jgi:hypothetical protein
MFYSVSCEILCLKSVVILSTEGGFEVLTAVFWKSPILKTNRRFGGSCLRMALLAACLSSFLHGLIFELFLHDQFVLI